MSIKTVLVQCGLFTKYLVLHNWYIKLFRFGLTFQKWGAYDIRVEYWQLFQDGNSRDMWWQFELFLSCSWCLYITFSQTRLWWPNSDNISVVFTVQCSQTTESWWN